MIQLLLPIIYLAFISLGLPDSLLGSAWPTMYPALFPFYLLALLVLMVVMHEKLVRKTRHTPL